MKENTDFNPVQLKLLALAELLADPAHWCQGPMATTQTGAVTTPNAPAARAWCIMGGLAKLDNARKPLECSRESSLAARAIRKVVGCPAWVFNDDKTRTTHAMVLSAIMAAVPIAADTRALVEA